jgi:hypothetical protein
VSVDAFIATCLHVYGRWYCFSDDMIQVANRVHDSAPVGLERQVLRFRSRVRGSVS